MLTEFTGSTGKKMTPERNAGGHTCMLLSTEQACAPNTLLVCELQSKNAHRTQRGSKAEDANPKASLTQQNPCLKTRTVRSEEEDADQVNQ